MASSNQPKFVVLPSSCVMSLADHENITLQPGNEMAAELAEDATYRLREVLSQATHHMRMSRRTKLKASDLTKVFKHSDRPPSYGVPNKLDFNFVNNTDAYVVPDGTVDLRQKLSALEDQQSTSERLPLSTLSFSWHDHNTVRDQRTNCNVGDSRENDVHCKYYSMVVECLLGDDRELFSLAVKDLRTNARISSALPFFVTLFSKVALVSHHRKVLSNMLCTMKAILDNPYLSPVRYLRPILESALYCVVIPVAVSTVSNDHWILRDYGAFVAADLVYRCPSHTLGLLKVVEKTVFEMLNDKNKPLCSHYGSLVLLSLLEIEFMIPLLLPMLTEYVEKFLATRLAHLRDTILTSDAGRVMSSVLLCVQRLVRDLPFNGKLSPADKKKLLEFDFSELLGDSLVALLPPPKHPPRDRVIKTRPADPPKTIRAAPAAPPRASASTLCVSDLFDLRNRHDFSQPSNKVIINYGRTRPLKAKRSMHRGNGISYPKPVTTTVSSRASSRPDRRNKLPRPVFNTTADLLSWV